MCGRFEIHSLIELLAKIFQIDSIKMDVKASYNVAPGQDIAIIVNDGKKNLLISSRWGFLPAWAKDKKTGYSMINARAETVDTTRSYKDAFLNHRCIVVADGFYEWQKLGKEKIPFYTRLRSKEPMGFAGLYNNWKSPEREELCTSTIITTDANDLAGLTFLALLKPASRGCRFFL